MIHTVGNLIYPPPSIVVGVGDLILIVGEPQTGKTATAHALAENLSNMHTARLVPVVVKDKYSLDLDVKLGRVNSVVEYVRILTLGRIVIAIMEPEDSSTVLSKAAAGLLCTVKGGPPLYVSNRKAN